MLVIGETGAARCESALLQDVRPSAGPLPRGNDILSRQKPPTQIQLGRAYARITKKCQLEHGVAEKERGGTSLLTTDIVHYHITMSIMTTSTTTHCHGRHYPAIVHCHSSLSHLARMLQYTLISDCAYDYVTWFFYVLSSIARHLCGFYNCLTHRHSLLVVSMSQHGVNRYCLSVAVGIVLVVQKVAG